MSCLCCSGARAELRAGGALKGGAGPFVSARSTKGGIGGACMQLAWGTESSRTLELTIYEAQRVSASYTTTQNQSEGHRRAHVYQEGCVRGGQRSLWVVASYTHRRVLPLEKVASHFGLLVGHGVMQSVGSGVPPAPNRSVEGLEADCDYPRTKNDQNQP